MSLKNTLIGGLILAVFAGLLTEVISEYISLREKVAAVRDSDAIPPTEQKANPPISREKSAPIAPVRERAPAPLPPSISLPETQDEAVQENSPRSRVREEGSTDDPMALAFSYGGSTPVLAKIAKTEVRLSPNTVASPGWPIGETRFTIGATEAIEVVGIFDNDAESRFTCKVRNKNGMVGYLSCGDLKIAKWLGDRGDLMEILMSIPYEYEEDWSPAELVRHRLEWYIEKYPGGRYAPAAEIRILRLACDVAQNADPAQAERARSDLQLDLSYIRQSGALRRSHAPVEVTWPREAHAGGWFQGRLTNVDSLWEFLELLRRRFPSPISAVESEDS